MNQRPQITASEPTQTRAGLMDGVLQRKCACGQHTIAGSECSSCSTEGNSSLKRSATSRDAAKGQGATIPAIVHAVLRSPGRRLDAETLAFMEPRFGHDFSHVRVHTGPQAAESARSVSARAYTVGRDIVLGKDNIGVETPQGRKLIAHELAHVVQQGGQTVPQPGEMRMTSPSDASEREADRAAATVSSGEALGPQTRNGVMLARDIDAGAAPMDAGAPAPGPRDAGPIAGAPAPPAVRGGGGAAPAPSPRTPVAAVTVTIPGVTFAGSANRIPPTQSATVPITVSGLPTGGSVAIDVEGSGGANGTATVTAGATATASGNVTVLGGTQTTPGNAGKLKLRAKVGTTVVGTSPGFTVAAWPTNFTISRNSDVDTPSALGLFVNIGCVSDGSGALSELDEVEHSERVDIGSRDNPPFTSEGATSATSGTSGFMAATSTPLIDRHRYARANIDTSTAGAGVYALVYRQNFLFNDRRTGVTDRVVRNSGFTINHVVGISPPVFGATVKLHQTMKTGAAVTVEGRATTAGSGTATSEFHTL